MKRIVYILFIFSTLLSTAQNKSTVETRALMRSIEKAKSIDAIPQTIKDRYPIRHDRQGATIGVLAKVNESFDATSLEVYGIKQTSRIADIAVLRVPLGQLHILESVSGIELFSVSHPVAADMDNTRVDTHTDSVQAGNGVPMPFNGEGVLIGITDWGFDYTHPNLTRQNNQRIERAWDHFKLSGPAPEGFDYGTEHVGYNALRTAKGDTSGLYGYGSHGTHVAGICGGLGTYEGKAIGQAPGAHYLLGSWYLDEASWLDQVAWMKKCANEMGRRLVINSSWGMYTFSTLDGTSLLSQALNSYADSGIVFVTSAGNNGDEEYHLRHVFGESDTLASIAAYYQSGIGQALIYWGEPPTSGSASGDFEAGFALVDKTDTTIMYRSPMFSTAQNIDYYESYVVAGNDTIHYDIMTEESNPLDSRPHVLLNVGRNDKYMLMMLCTADSETLVNVWNVANISNHAGNMGCAFGHGNMARCTRGDNYYGIGEPACAEKTLSVAAHTADRYSGANLTTGTLASFSSYGPTLDGRAKPDISAPGYGVISSISYWTDGEYHAKYEAISSGRRYIWASMSGTSMSSPAVTGIVALMLEANPHLTTAEVCDIIRSTSRNDDKTGPLHANDSVSVRWGWGKVDAINAVNAAYDRLSIEEAAKIRPALVVAPNPAANVVTVLTGSNKPETLEIFSIDGRMVQKTTITSSATIDLSELDKGVYIMRVQDRAGVRTAKVVKQ